MDVNLLFKKKKDVLEIEFLKLSVRLVRPSIHNRKSKKRETKYNVLLTSTK